MPAESVTHPDSDTIDDGITWLNESRQLHPDAIDAEQLTLTRGGRSDVKLHSIFMDLDVTQMTQGTSGRSKLALNSIIVANKSCLLV